MSTVTTLKRPSMRSSRPRFSLTAPAPRIVLVPDHLFFIRVVPIADAASATDVTNQVELTLESLSPFPLAQLYYAHYWVPGARSALIYAAYRKRFTSEQVESWLDAEVVLPTFASLLTAEVGVSTTVVLTQEESLTAIHWGESSAMPAAVVARNWSADTSEQAKQQIRDEVLASFGETKTVIDLITPPVAELDGSVGEFAFKSGPIEAHYTREQLDDLDVRDKSDLAAIRRARGRDVFLWRAFLACAAGVFLAGLLEIGLIGGRFWQRSREAVEARQAPLVAEILRAQTLATRIDEFSSKRLRPIEMIELVGTSKQPPSLFFLQTRTSGLYALDIEGQANQPGEVGQYQDSLRQIPELLKVEVPRQETREGVSTFRMLITFKPDAFKNTPQ